jgi:signal transduction histidine kinase
LLAVLDEHRQIIAFNDSFLKMLGTKDPARVLSLRPGEVLQCIHSHKEPGGCGTSKYCSTCGAAIAIVACMEHDKPAERICALEIMRGKNKVDVVFRVKAHAIMIESKKFILLYLQDITQEQQKAALERTFFHDINNLLGMLVGSSELMVINNPSNHAKNILNASLRLHKEVAIQRYLSQSNASKYQPFWGDYTPLSIIEELQTIFENHPAAVNRHIIFPDSFPGTPFKTDISLLLRVLCNMVINALEATPAEGTVKILLTSKDKTLAFSVFNNQEIPESIAKRIFQRNFSTKNETGRGIGTFSMKLFGEKFLGGKVDFKTSRESGTVFSLRLPL